MSVRFVLIISVALLCASSAERACAQQTEADTSRTDSTAFQDWQDSVWKPIVVQKGVEVRYIFYQEADNHNNGVVIRLHNTNAHPIRYAFTIIFRTPEKEATAEASGRLKAGEMKTGGNDGLFWIPFEDQSSIGEVGIRGLSIRRDRRGGS